MRKKRLPVNHVNEENPRQEGYKNNETGKENIDKANSIKELDQLYLAALNRIQGRGRAGGVGGAPRRQPPRNASRQTPGDRPPKKLQNCGGEHAMPDCFKPVVDRAQRPCWVCDKIGHR